MPVWPIAIPSWFAYPDARKANVPVLHCAVLFSRHCPRLFSELENQRVVYPDRHAGTMPVIIGKIIAALLLCHVRLRQVFF